MLTINNLQVLAIVFLTTFLVLSYIRSCKEETFEIKQKRFKKIGATYKVTFQTTWDPNHPESGLRVFFRDPPPQFGALTGVTHHHDFRFWSPGQHPSAGVRRLALTGDTKQFQDESDFQIRINQAEFIIKGSPLMMTETKEDENKKFETSTTFPITKEFPLVTILMKMIPSPDYFLGISGKSLLDTDGEFVSSLTVPLTLYDAGINKSPFDVTPQEQQLLNPSDVVKPVMIGNQRRYLKHGGILRFERILEG